MLYAFSTNRVKLAARKLKVTDNLERRSSKEPAPPDVGHPVCVRSSAWCQPGVKSSM